MRPMFSGCSSVELGTKSVKVRLTNVSQSTLKATGRSTKGENPMKESTLSKITAAGAVAKGMAQRALAASPNPKWTEYEKRSVDEWIARQDVKLDRSEAIRRLVELGLKAKK